jgi:hypothetical protein
MEAVLGVRIAAVKQVVQVSSDVMAVRMTTSTHLDRPLSRRRAFFQDAQQESAAPGTNVTQNGALPILRLCRSHGPGDDGGSS